jgi:uncharacterized protein YndB with AHSA1/START domain
MFEYDGTKTFLLAAAVGLAIAPANPASTEVASDVDERNATALDIEVEGKIAHPLGAVSAVLLDLDGFQRWFPALRDWRVLSRGKEIAVVYGRQELPWPLRDRDYVVEYQWRATLNTEFILKAVARPGADPPPRSGVLRLEEMTTEWRLIARGDETTARYSYRGPVDVPLPDGIVQAVWEAHSAKVIEALADEVARRVK